MSQRLAREYTQRRQADLGRRYRAYEDREGITVSDDGGDCHHPERLFAIDTITKIQAPHFHQLGLASCRCYFHRNNRSEFFPALQNGAYVVEGKKD